MPDSPTVLVGMSGGVDSSTVAAILQGQGYHVIGVFMNVWDPTDERLSEPRPRTCYGPGKEKDIADARRICEKLGVQFLQINVAEAFTKNVLNYFAYEYEHARTPNPCVLCNLTIKFGALWEQVQALGVNFDYFATGHYVRKVRGSEDTRWSIGKAVDQSKDQTYFLYRLTQEQLQKCLFPLGDLTKDEVRKLAEDYGLAVAHKKESQNFVDGDYSYLLTGDYAEGDFIDTAGNVLGRHRGLPFYTIGQRKGIGLAGPHPWYVIEMIAETNQVVLGQQDQLLANSLVVADLNWLAISGLDEACAAEVKIRYAAEPVPATLYPLEQGRIKVVFKSDVRAITPGQSAVFYQKDVVLGGGIITV